MEFWREKFGIRPCQMNHRPSFKIQSQSRTGNLGPICTAEVRSVAGTTCRHTSKLEGRTLRNIGTSRNAQDAHRPDTSRRSYTSFFMASHEQLCIDNEDNSALEFGRFSLYPSPRVGARRYTRASKPQQPLLPPTSSTLGR